MGTGVEGTTQVHVYQIKKADKGEIYKKKIKWMLRELKVIDGKDKEKVQEQFTGVFVEPACNELSPLAVS